MRKILTRNHIFLTSASDIDTILTPLKRFGITHFTYMANYLDGKQVYLSNHAQWVEDYYRLNLYKSSSFEANPVNYQNGYSIWQPDAATEVLTHGRQYFDSDNGITIIQKNNACCEFYFFSASVSNRSIINFYINNLDILDNFINYFKLSARDIIKKAENNKIYLSNHYTSLGKDTANAALNVYTDLRQAFLSEVNSQSAVMHSVGQGINQLGNFVLSKRQAQCLQYLLEGKSAKQTANMLNLSTRTIEFYLDNMKKKMNCRTKLELAGKVMKIVEQRAL